MGKNNRTKRRTGRKSGRKTQKLWNMRGCAHNKYSKCSKCSRRKRSGGCGCDKISGGRKKSRSFSFSRQKGGCGCGNPVLGGLSQSGGTSALVGSPWTANISNWPGVQGISGQTNYYPLNEYKVDPQTQVGFERDQMQPTKGGSRKKRGGDLFPQDLVNIGRNMMFGVGSAYNSLSGYQAPVSPLPYKNQLDHSVKTLGYL